MKKVFALTLVSFLGFGLFSCNSDDDSNPEAQFSIVGTWKVTEKYINGNIQDISEECVYNGGIKFINGGTYVEDVYMETDEVPCTLVETIGGTWSKSGNNYTLNITTQGYESMMPETFIAEIDGTDYSHFEISETSLGTTTTLVFTRQ